MADDSGLSWGRYCLTCNQHYYEIKSIGKWQCKYHPLPLLRNGEGKLYGLPDGTYACCGTSPSPYLPSGKRNPHFNSLKLKGCCAKDHSSLQFHFGEEDNIPYNAWPEKLRIAMDEDIQNLLRGNTNVVHRGIDIDKNDELLIRRYDKKTHDERIKS